MVDAEEARKRSTVPFYENMKRVADQEERRAGVAKRVETFAQSVKEKEAKKHRFLDELTQKYAIEKEEKYNEE